MNNSKISTLIVAILAVITFGGSIKAADFPKGSPAFFTDHAAALKASKESGKPLIMVFSAAWCGPCQVNKKNVYPSAEVKAYHDKFVWAYLDVDDKANLAAIKSAGVSGIPHIEIVDKNQKSISKSVGATTPTNFAKTLAAALGK